MRKRKRIPMLFFLSVFFLLNAFNSATAQNDSKQTMDYKYEIAFDITPFFKEASPWKAQFKFFDYNGNKLKGAYRLGVDFSYNYLTFPKAEEKGKNHHISNGLTLGYEHYIDLNSTKIYFGADLAGYFTIQKHNPIDVNDYRRLECGIRPFLGIKRQIIDYLAISFEIGWNHSLIFYKDLDTELPNYEDNKSMTYQTYIEIPYAFTVNYRF